MKFPDEVIRNTLVDYPRLERIVGFVKQTSQVPGAIAEVGVYKGGTAYLIALTNLYKFVYLFDTFDGMPEVCEKDRHEKGDFSDTNFYTVKQLLKGFNVNLYRGIFPKSLTQSLKNQCYSFVHLDCDIYQSVNDGLQFFYPRMSKGGIIAIDDYAEPNCPGAKLATDEFFKDKPEKLLDICQSQTYIIKE